MYYVLGITKKDNQIHKQVFSNYIAALNFMSYLQHNGVGFILSNSFPSAYPAYKKASELVNDEVNVNLWPRLIKLDKLQNINATKMLLSI